GRAVAGSRVLPWTPGRGGGARGSCARRQRATPEAPPSERANARAPERANARTRERILGKPVLTDTIRNRRSRAVIGSAEGGGTRVNLGTGFSAVAVRTVQAAYPCASHSANFVELR